MFKELHPNLKNALTYGAVAVIGLVGAGYLSYKLNDDTSLHEPATPVPDKVVTVLPPVEDVLPTVEDVLQTVEDVLQTVEDVLPTVEDVLPPDEDVLPPDEVIPDAHESDVPTALDVDHADNVSGS